MEVIKRIKQYKRQVYMCRQLSHMAGFELLSDKQKEAIEDFDKDINEFVNLESHFSIIKIYSNLAEKELMKTTNLTEPKFLESLKDMTAATNLGDQEQQETEGEINRIIE